MPTYREQVADASRAVIIAALQEHNGDTTQAAAVLRLPISTLYRHCRALGIKPQEYAKKGVGHG